MGEILGALAGLLIVFIVLILGVYIAQAIFLNKFNKLVNGKGTALAWIPICNVYLLGKLNVNKIFGWVLLACIFLSSNYTTTIGGVEKSYGILPSGISKTISSLYGLAVLGLFIYAIVKYSKLKKASKNNNIGQPLNNGEVVNQTVMPQPMIYNNQPADQTINVNTPVGITPTQTVAEPFVYTAPVESVLPQPSVIAQPVGILVYKTLIITKN